MRTIAFLLAVAILPAQQPHDELLTRVTAKVKAATSRLANYMCTETVERAQFDLDNIFDRSASCESILTTPKPTHETTSDRLRLDVGIGAKGEMFSWAGENRFHDLNVGELVREGAISNGSFTSLLKIIFDGDPAVFFYQGEKTEGDRTYASYSFRVALDVSHYKFTKRTTATTAYEGTFLVDPKTADLVRLIVRTKDLPIDTGACQATTTLQYRQPQMKDAEFMLPAYAGLRIVNTDGSESNNRTVFSNCHEFLGESTLSFGATSAQPSARPPTPPIAIPDGITFEIALTEDVDTATAAVGDPIRARLAGPLRGSSSKVLVPAGTPVTGRVVEMRHYYGFHPIVLLRFRLETLLVNGTPQPFVARAPRPGMITVGRDGLQRRVPLGTARSLDDPSGPAMVFADPNHDAVVKAGAKSEWITGAIPKTAPVTPSAPVPPVATDPTDVLSAALIKLAPTLTKLPRYLCTQTIERAQFDPAGPSPGFPTCDDVLARKESAEESTSDRLRLDVAVGINGELYSWAGENRFGERNFADFAQGGAFSSGTFSSLLKMVFESDMATFSFDAEDFLDGRNILRYRFNVPAEQSHYWFGPEGRRFPSSYSGTISIDAATLDLVRLRVRSGQLPAGSGACEATESISYKRISLAGDEFLLPLRAQMLVTGLDGTVSDSTSTFAGCREYTAQSAVSFKDPGTAPPLNEHVSTAPPISLPAGIRFTVAFSQDIPGAIAAGGDLIRARLVTPLIDASGTILAGPDTAVTGRILRMRRFYGRTPALRIEFRLDSIEIGGVPHPVSAAPAPGPPMAGTQFTGIPEVRERSTAVLYFEKAAPDFVVRRDILSNWITY